MDADDLKLSDPAFFGLGPDGPQAIWARWRESDSVHRTASNVGRDYWSITRHADIQSVFKNAALFSSQMSGGTLPTNRDLMDPKKSTHARLSLSGAMLPILDPPRHTKARALFVERFTPRVISELEPRIRAQVATILDRLEANPECDFVTNVAARLPMAMIFHLMDVPEADWETMFNVTNSHAAPSDPEFATGKTILETRETNFAWLIAYFKELGKKRRNNPGEDLVSLIATSKVDGELFGDDELGFLGHMFAIAGQETTRNTLSAGMLELIRHPNEWQRLRSDPALLNTVSDEFLRWACPVVHLLRTATADTELGGKQIARGDWLVNWLPSANRDDKAFRDPLRFDVGRKPNNHLSFGTGPHFCLGFSLARLQIRIMMQEILRRFESFELSGSPEYMASIQFGGLKRLKIKATVNGAR